MPLLTQHTLRRVRVHVALGLVFTLVVLLGGFATPAQAQPATDVSMQAPPELAGKAPYRLIYDHLTEEIELRNERGKVLEHWERTPYNSPLAEIPPNRPIVVEIAHANTLLYNYDVEVNEVRQKAIASCRGLGGQFLSQGFLVSSAALGERPVRELDADTQLSSLLDLSTNASSRGTGTAAVSTQMLQTTLRNVRRPLNDFLAFGEAVSRLAPSLEDSLAQAAVEAEYAPMEAVLTRLQASVDAVQEGLSDPARVPLAVRRRTGQIRPQMTALLEVNTAIREGRFEGDQNDALALEALDLQEQVETTVAEVGTASPQLQATLARIKQAQTRAHRTFTIGPSGGAVRRLIIHLRPTAAFEPVLRTREGTTGIYTEPYQQLICQLALGVTWVDPLPAYGEEDSLLVNTADTEREIAASFMFHIAHARFPLVGAVLGVGIGENRSPNLLLGASLRFFDPIMINIGAVWRRTPRLTRGLEMGQPVTVPFDAEDLDKRYERSLFFGVSFAR